MRVLIAGNGGREHALAWRLARCANTQVFAIPGNPGIAAVADCLPAVGDLNPRTILAAAKSLNADLTIIGPEAPLVAGVVDLFRSEGRAVLGPTAQASQLEGSKVFAKNFFRQHGIPTAEFVTVNNPMQAIRSLDQFNFPVVIKADGLASGKGVVIVLDRAQAESAIHALGPNLVIEECLRGPEVSFMVLCDGRTFIPLLPCRDHKRLLDGDHGPNTGGMGAICDPDLLTDAERASILETIIQPTVAASGFTGFLYAGLMMTASGPKLLEYNVRLGDPETQALLYQLKTDPAELFLETSRGGLSSLGLKNLEWHKGASACVVLAAEGYPGSPRTGDAISGMDLAQLSGAAVFQAGTRIGWSGPVTAGGRVLGVTASGPTREVAANRAYEAIGKIRFEGMQYRKDIGRQG